MQKNTPYNLYSVFKVSALPIFPGRFQPSIFGANELNYRVRDGNGWTLIAINTDSEPTGRKSVRRLFVKTPHFKWDI